jgi:eukaryotic-like serine/threonine-protein kinase
MVEPTAFHRGGNMADWDPLANEIFLRAIEAGSASERAAVLDQSCGGDVELRRKVEALLMVHDGAGSFLEHRAPGLVSARSVTSGEGATLPTLEPGRSSVRVAEKTEPFGPNSISSDNPVSRPFTEGPGTRIGPYKLLQQIGEGGMGVVYMAEQEAPVRRKVALKIIKPGMDTGQVVARFEAERQALALMDHPNIATVLDAGATGTGRPFFVMELVNGIPITDYCDEARLGPRARLELFIPVCRAIQHAHQKGVIHRDVKPSNVLVTLIDGKPVPKVIDFGIAKATDQRLTEKSLFTQFGSVVGTLEYMSPEQADLSGLDVDTRSDVYSLGVLLYELLTGTTPLERSRLREAGYAEILRRIMEEEPPKPSTRLSGSGDRLASIAVVRGSEPARLARLVRGDLDWIAMKALAKARTRRYESAVGFARDVERYLAGEAIEARPPSAGYRLGKLARRHRVALAVAAGFALVLVAGAAISLALAARAIRAERVTSGERDRAREAESEARRSAAEARAVLGFFQDRVLAAARPEGEEGGLGREATIRGAMEAAEPKIAEAFRSQPTTEASVRHTLGRTYVYLGEPGRAIGQLERAAELRAAQLGPDHSDTLHTRNNLAEAYLDAGRTAEAIALHEATLRQEEAKLGPDHPDTLISRVNLAAAYLKAGRTVEAITLHEATLKACEAKLGPDHPETLNSRNNLAGAFLGAGRTAEALLLFEATVKAYEAKFGLDHPETLNSRNNLAGAYRESGRTAEALALFETTLKAQESKLGPDHPETLASRNNLAAAYFEAGRTAEALRLFEATLKAYEATLGPDHPQTLRTRGNLAETYRTAGRTAEALALTEATLRAQEATLGPGHPDTLGSRNSLANAHFHAGRIAESVALHEANLKLCETKLGPDHPNTLTMRNNVAGAYRRAGRWAEALLLNEANLKTCEAKLGPDHPDTLQSRYNVAMAYQFAGRMAEAIALHEANLKAREAKLGPDHPDTLLSRDNLARAYRGAGRWAEAEPLLRDSLARARQRFGPADPRTAGAMASLGLDLAAQEKWAEAEPLVRESLKIFEAKQPDDWATFHARNLLGACLLARRQFAEAEPLIVRGYEGMKARESKIPPAEKLRLQEAAARVVRFYEAWSKPDEAARWRKTLDAAPPKSR